MLISLSEFIDPILSQRKESVAKSMKWPNLSLTEKTGKFLRVFPGVHSSNDTIISQNSAGINLFNFNFLVSYQF
ncbi:hypothetical protein SAMN00777080_2383 [Aquiflexum balticum DSM 16537]|uniref:Uncharacterized protein n=1 Tax=Aquiflexum balticum DSM 16537 TaxID=758820 RepID=A0A1W2H4T0_9BACT|nr:hypothetical protein SAMN00777080_2383 [Aquiflexum balticum DSM 16537]